MFLAQSDFPCTVVGQKDCATTAFRYRFAAAACCHGRSVPLYRRTGALPIPTQPPSLELSFRASPRCHCCGNPSPSAPEGALYIVAAQCAAPTFCGALHRKRRDLIIATPHGREFPKGEGAHALSLWTLQGDGIFKGRGKFGIPLPLNGVFGYFCRCWQK